MALLQIFLFSTLIFILVKLSMRPVNFPPGPRCWPLLGCVIYLFKKEQPSKILQDLGKFYGPVVGFFLGANQPVISITGPEAIKEALLNEDLGGLMSADEKLWQEQHRFTQRYINALKFGNTSLDSYIVEEIRDLLVEIAAIREPDPEHAVDFKSIFKTSIVNSLWNLIGGKRLERNEIEFKRLLANIDQLLQTNSEVQKSFKFFGMVDPLPMSILKWLGFLRRSYRPLQNYFAEKIEEHHLTRKRSKAQCDFIDAYLDEMKRMPVSSPCTSFSKKQLIAVMQSLFLAGTETTSETIDAFIRYMIRYPIVQRNMQMELDKVCGSSLPSLTDRPSLPYANAVLMEVMRMSSVVPIAVPRRALDHTELQRYTIPKGSIVLINLDSALKDAAVWEDPDNFRPERHLDKNGQLIENSFFIPFGQGKQMCPGKSWAWNTVFLVAVALVKAFEFRELKNEPHHLEKSSAPSFSGRFKAVVNLRASSI